MQEVEVSSEIDSLLDEEEDVGVFREHLRSSSRLKPILDEDILVLDEDIQPANEMLEYPVVSMLGDNTVETIPSVTEILGWPVNSCLDEELLQDIQPPDDMLDLPVDGTLEPERYEDIQPTGRNLEWSDNFSNEAESVADIQPVDHILERSVNGMLDAKLTAVIQAFDNILEWPGNATLEPRPTEGIQQTEDAMKWPVDVKLEAGRTIEGIQSAEDILEYHANNELEAGCTTEDIQSAEDILDHANNELEGKPNSCFEPVENNLEYPVTSTLQATTYECILPVEDVLKLPISSGLEGNILENLVSNHLQAKSTDDEQPIDDVLECPVRTQLTEDIQPVEDVWEYREINILDNKSTEDNQPVDDVLEDPVKRIFGDFHVADVQLVEDVLEPADTGRSDGKLMQWNTIDDVLEQSVRGSVDDEASRNIRRDEECVSENSYHSGRSSTHSGIGRSSVSRHSIEVDLAEIKSDDLNVRLVQNATSGSSSHVANDTGKSSEYIPPSRPVRTNRSPVTDMTEHTNDATAACNRPIIGCKSTELHEDVLFWPATTCHCHAHSRQSSNGCSSDRHSSQENACRQLVSESSGTKPHGQWSVNGSCELEHPLSESRHLPEYSNGDVSASRPVNGSHAVTTATPPAEVTNTLNRPLSGCLTTDGRPDVGICLVSVTKPLGDTQQRRLSDIRYNSAFDVLDPDVATSLKAVSGPPSPRRFSDQHMGDRGHTTSVTMGFATKPSGHSGNNIIRGSSDGIDTGHKQWNSDFTSGRADNRKINIHGQQNTRHSAKSEESVRPKLTKEVSVTSPSMHQSDTMKHSTWRQDAASTNTRSATRPLSHSRSTKRPQHSVLRRTTAKSMTSIQFAPPPTYAIHNYLEGDDLWETEKRLILKSVNLLPENGCEMRTEPLISAAAGNGFSQQSPGSATEQLLDLGSSHRCRSAQVENRLLWQRLTESRQKYKLELARQQSAKCRQTNYIRQLEQQVGSLESQISQLESMISSTQRLLASSAVDSRRQPLHHIHIISSTR
jgi:hypothetical protein